MNRWQAFLDSLTTPGGKMAVVVSMLVFIVIIVAIAHFRGQDPAEQGKLLLSNAFTALFSTLLGYLGGGSKTS